MWKPPKDDGGNRITHYVIEKRDTSKGKDNWVTCSDICKETFINVPGLIENQEYEFRVMAVNQNGVSEPLTTTANVLIKLPFMPPEAPSELEVNEVGTNFVGLSWSKPASDGGGPISGYWVERKEKGSEKWIKCNLSPIQFTGYNVPNLIENKEYEFRVFAENEAGFSKPCLANKTVKVN
jgi:hypothetical protein